MSHNSTDSKFITDPSERLRRNITLLNDEQRAKIYDEAIDDMPDARKPELAKILPKPADDKNDKVIEAVDDKAKATAADFVALSLPADKQAKISEKVAAMLQEAQDSLDKKQKKESEETESPHKTVHHAHQKHRLFSDAPPDPRQRPHHRLDGYAGRRPHHENLSRCAGRLAEEGRSGEALRPAAEAR